MRKPNSYALIIGPIALVLALWMGASTWAFGFDGQLTPWYIGAIGTPFLISQLWVAHRMRITTERGRSFGRSPWSFLALSWLCAIGFGFTVPDLVSGEWVSVLSHLTTPDLAGLSIGVCNPLGILAFTFTGVALAIAIIRGRDPRPEDADDYDPQMVAHPLSTRD